MKFRIGNGYDVHKLEEGLRLVLCGIEIPHTKGFVAHSDGDVAIHALCDALLGAIAAGDIGKHFPDSSMEFKGIDSRILLKRVCALLDEKGYRIENCDVTIIAQRPKIAGYIQSMREELAKTMRLDVDLVSVKATTSEKLGFTGREEGIATYATALVSHE